MSYYLIKAVILLLQSCILDLQILKLRTITLFKTIIPIMIMAIATKIIIIIATIIIITIIIIIMIIIVIIIIVTITITVVIMKLKLSRILQFYYFWGVIAVQGVIYHQRVRKGVIKLQRIISKLKEAFIPTAI